MKIFSPISEALDSRSNIKAANFDRRSTKFAKLSQLGSLPSRAQRTYPKGVQALTFSNKGKVGGDVFSITTHVAKKRQGAVNPESKPKHLHPKNYCAISTKRQGAVDPKSKPKHLRPKNQSAINTKKQRAIDPESKPKHLRPEN